MKIVESISSPIQSKISVDTTQTVKFYSLSVSVGGLGVSLGSMEQGYF